MPRIYFVLGLLTATPAHERNSLVEKNGRTSYRASLASGAILWLVVRCTAFAVDHDRHKILLRFQIRNSPAAASLNFLVPICPL